MDYASLTESQQQQQQQQYYTQPHDQQQQHAYEPTQGQHQAQPSAYDAYYAYPTHTTYDYQPQQQEGAPPQQDGGGAYEVPPGLNPAAAAAVAALSQLSQLADTMDAAERAMAGTHPASHGPPIPPQHHPHRFPQTPPQHRFRRGVPGRPPFRGKGRKGGGTFRGGGRGNFGGHPSRPDGGAPPFRGRGRGHSQGRIGRSGGRRSFHSAAAGTQASCATVAPAPTFTLELSSAPVPTMESSAVAATMQASAKAPAPATLVAPALPKFPLLPIAWCDICRVDCNSLEILEQHKNGKRHKRTVQRIQEIQAQQKLMADLQAKVTGKTGMVVQPIVETMDVVVAEAHEAPSAPEQQSLTFDGQTQPDNLEPSNRALVTEARPFEAPPTDAPSSETPPSKAPPSEAPPTGPPPRRSRMDGFDRYGKRQGSKRNMMRFVRGGKRMRCSETQAGSRPPERPKAQPRVCTLCNVMCDTLPTFETHLAGKKHISRIKRFQGHGMVYGPVTVYIPPNQLEGHAPPGPEPLFFGLTTPEMIQQGAQVYAGMPMDCFGHQQSKLPGEASQAKNAVQVVQVEQELNHQGDRDVEILELGQNPVAKSEARELGPLPETVRLEAEVAPPSDNELPAAESTAFPAEDVMLPPVKIEDPSATVPLQNLACPSRHNEV